MLSYSLFQLVSSLFSIVQYDIRFVQSASFFVNPKPYPSSKSLLKRNMYWNRESSTPNQYNIEAPIVQSARIISVSDIHDPANDVLHRLRQQQEDNHGTSVQLVAVGGNGGIDDFDIQALQQIQPNIIFMSHPKGKEILVYLLQHLPSIEWIHFRSAGIDAYISPALLTILQNRDRNTTLQMTNAKGIFSSTLAEYTMLAISYFAKDLPRLMKQKQDKVWCKYPILEIRKTTLGIIGLGDIGQATATLAKAYGMHVIALQRNKKKNTNTDDESNIPTTPHHVDQIYYIQEGGKEKSLYLLLQQSDYILISTPLTDETKGMIDKEAFEHIKPGAVIINVGRGPIIDETIMIQELKPGGKLKGAALDVFTVEPLPETSELWTLPNTLISPHNMDKTELFMHESTEFFLYENIPRFLRNQTLFNPVNPFSGY